MKEYLLKRPMLMGAVFCVIISVTGYYSKTAVIAAGILYTVMIGVMIAGRIKPQILFSLILCFIMLVSTVVCLNREERLSKNDGMRYTAKAVVCSIEYSNPGYNCAVMQINDPDALADKAKVICFYEPVPLSIGQTVTADFKFSSNDSEYRASNISENIFLSANVSDIRIIEGRNDFVLSAIGKIRDYIRETLFSNMGYEEASTMCALVFGDRTYFTDEFYNNVKAAGVSHVMVVSGMHLSVLVLFVLKITERLFYNRFVRAFTMIAVVIVLTAVCGFTMSILRAGITYVLAAFALLLKRDSDPANTLGGAVVIILTFSPFAVFSIAFQLSVLSTFGILAVSVPVTRYFDSRRLIKPKCLRILFSSVSVTLSAMVMTLPVTIYIFGYVSTVSVVANILISYAVTLALSITVTALAANLKFPFLSLPLLSLSEIIVSYINRVINVLGSLDFSVIELPRQAAFGAFVFIIIIFYLMLACKKRIDMIKLKEMRNKVEKEGGKRLKWQ